MNDLLNFEEDIEQGHLVLLDFFAQWCGPCKIQSDILDEFKKEINGGVRIYKIDIEKELSVIKNYKILGVPTLVLYECGKEKWRYPGVATLKEIRKQVLG